MKKNFADSVKSGIFQFLMLVAGVWLALMANDWSESKKRKEDTFANLHVGELVKENENYQKMVKKLEIKDENKMWKFKFGICNWSIPFFSPRI